MRSNTHLVPRAASTTSGAQEILVYEAHWNIKAKPFENDFDTTFFVDTKSHREALNRIVFASAERKSLVLLTADHGLGKTFVAHVAMRKLASQGGAAGLIADPSQDPEDFLQQVNAAFGVSADTIFKHGLMEALCDYLEGVGAGGGRSTLFIDNADTIQNAAVLTEMRKLLDLSGADGRNLLTVVLIAHPSFHAMLRTEPGLVQDLPPATHSPRYGATSYVRKPSYPSCVRRLWRSSKACQPPL